MLELPLPVLQSTAGDSTCLKLSFWGGLPEGRSQTPAFPPLRRLKVGRQAGRQRHALEMESCLSRKGSCSNRQTGAQQDAPFKAIFKVWFSGCGTSPAPLCGQGGLKATQICPSSSAIAAAQSANAPDFRCRDHSGQLQSSDSCRVASTGTRSTQRLL